LSNLDVSKNPDLGVLDCSSTQLINLDVSMNSRLIVLYCAFNQLASLDVSRNTILNFFDCSGNQLSSLDVSNNRNIWRLDIGEMPSLYKVCVWEMPFPQAFISVYKTNSPNVYFTTDCAGGK
jgi:Leucine-rich repeat (LRR) protein